MDKKELIESKYRAFPFWSWNDKLDKDELVEQVQWMHDVGIGGFFMHARGGLTTEYLGKEWFECIEACCKKAKELDMEAYAYDENGWPSGFVGGKLLEDPENHDMEISSSVGEFDPKAIASYDISGEKIVRVYEGKNVLNVFVRNSACTADILSKKVVDQFIKLTHEEYKKHDIYGNLRGFFTDEPQYYRWGMPYTRVLPEYFKKTYGTDILDELGLLFVDKKGFRTFRYRYWKAMQDLMLRNFAENVYSWCDKNGYKATGHYIEETSLNRQMWCCAGIMPFYEWEHIPGIDVLGRSLNRTPSPKQLGSVAAQLGKEQRMAEIFACTGWDATPNELKLLADYVMVGGVNILCPHLLPYHESGQRKRDYPEHFSNINPWVDKDFKKFNDHYAELGKMLAKSIEVANVGVLQPIRSCYFNYKSAPYVDETGISNKVDAAFTKDNLTLEENHIPYHFIDETILARHGSVNGKKLVVGNYNYDYLIIPTETLTMDANTEKLLREYVNNGGKVLLLGEKPQYLEGEEFDYPYLKSNTSLEEIINSNDMNMAKNESVVCSYWVNEAGEKYIFALNTGEKTSVSISAKGFKNVKIDGVVQSPEVTFDKYESKIIYFTNEDFVKPEPKEIIHLGKNFKIAHVDKNYIALDLPQYSKDGKNYSKPFHYMCIFEKMLKERYQGDLYLRYAFNVKTIPNKCDALIENTRIKEVYVNGVVVKKNGFVLEKDLWKYDVAHALKEGENEIIVHMDMFESEAVYYALYGENVTESLKNCLAYDTTIEAIFLQGDFGVYGDFKQEENGFVANEFYLDKQKEDVTDIVTDGYPFLRGEVTLTQNINVLNTNCVLEFTQRFQMIDVIVNGKFVDRLMFKNKVDLSDYLVKGNNEIQLKLIISNRNLLGLHHHVVVEHEFGGVGPYSFERFGTWTEDGESPIYKKRYGFVKVI